MISRPSLGASCLAATALTLGGAAAAPASAAAPVRVAGDAVLAAGSECRDAPYDVDNAPAGVPPLHFVSGELIGCLYTDTSDPRVVRQGNGTFRLLDRGEETFIGELSGDAVSFRTRYVVVGVFDGDPLQDPGAGQLSGFCHHPAISGATGALHFVDDVDTGVIEYRGVLSPAAP